MSNFKVGDEVEIAYRDFPHHICNGITATIKEIIDKIDVSILVLDRSDWHIRYPYKMLSQYDSHSIWDHSVKLVDKLSNIPEPSDSDLI